MLAMYNTPPDTNVVKRDHAISDQQGDAWEKRTQYEILFSSVLIAFRVAKGSARRNLYSNRDIIPAVRTDRAANGWGWLASVLYCTSEQHSCAVPAVKNIEIIATHTCRKTGHLSQSAVECYRGRNPSDEQRALLE